MFGQRLVEKMGWGKGRGLRTNLDGINTKGIQIKATHSCGNMTRLFRKEGEILLCVNFISFIVSTISDFTCF
jgi:hypothetical protein